MPVIQCVCGRRLAGADDDALFDALRRHSDEAHAAMQLSDDRIRGMLAARGRLATWEGERTPVPGPVEIRPLTPERLGDFLRFFDRDAFMDNPAWAACYCFFYHFTGSPDEWQTRTSEQNREAKSELIQQGAAQGYLAYVGDAPVGWCHAAPRDTLPGLAGLLAGGDHTDECIGSIVCFNIAAPYRRQGIATRLLAAACEGLRSRGLTVAEAYPPKEARSEARTFHGPLAMYLAAGFAPVREANGYVTVRKRLTVEETA